MTYLKEAKELKEKWDKATCWEAIGVWEEMEVLKAKIEAIEDNVFDCQEAIKELDKIVS